MRRVEYFGYARRLPLLRLHRSRDNAVLEDLVRASTPFFVLPLQLSADAQIRDHSRFEDMLEVIECVMGSFARHAAVDAKLVIKNHPLDLGLVNYSRVIRAPGGALCRGWPCGVHGNRGFGYHAQICTGDGDGQQYGRCTFVSAELSYYSLE